MYFEVLKRFDHGKTLPLLHPIDDMEINDKKLEELLNAK